MTEYHLEIFTDGSFCPSTGCSGYGICLDINQLHIHAKLKGRYHTPVRNSITAELIAVCRGVLHANTMLTLNEFKSITIVTDAPGVREAFKRVTHAQRDLFRLVSAAKDLINKFAIKIRTIKGHQPKHDSRDAFLNHRCDVMAKREMRQWRDSEYPMCVNGIVTRRRERRITRAQARAELKSRVPDLWN